LGGRTGEAIPAVNLFHSPQVNSNKRGGGGVGKDENKPHPDRCSVSPSSNNNNSNYNNRLEERARTMRNRLFSVSEPGSGSHFSSLHYLRAVVLRTVALFSSNINSILVDKKQQEQAQQLTNTREDSVLHRSLLVATVLASFCGRPRPHSVGETDPQEKAVFQEIKKYRKAAGTAAKDEERTPATAAAEGGVAGNSNNNWGPILVVVKFTDLDEWEAGLKAVLQDCYQLEVMSYFGSDSDRMALRSYLRALCPAGGLHTVGSDCYNERSHCHVILTSYETFLLDCHYFKEILFFTAVFDQPWGFFAQDKYSATRQQISEVLRAKHRLFCCDDVLSSSSSFSSSVVSEAVTQVVLPDLFSVVQAVAPQFLGLSSSSSPTNNSRREGRGVLYLGSPALSGVIGEAERAAGGTMTVDEKGLFYLQGIVAALTVIYDSSFFEDLSRSQSLNDKQEQQQKQQQQNQKNNNNKNNKNDKNEQQQTDSATIATANGVVITDLLNLLSWLLWTNSTVRLIHPGDSEQEKEESKKKKTSRTFVFSKDSPLLPTHLKQLLSYSSSGVELILSADRSSSHSSFEWIDCELENELKQVNLSAVGKTGAGLQRLLIENYYSSSSVVAVMEEEQRESGLGLGGELSSTAGSGGRGGRGSGRGSGRGRGRGRGRGAAAAQSQSQSLNEDERSGQFSHSDALSNRPPTSGGRGGRGGGRGGRGGRKPGKAGNPNNNPNSGSFSQQDQENDELDDVEGGGDKRGGPGGGRALLSMEEEMSRYITRKGGVWSASIIVLARQKFLGFFKDEESAKKVFEAAFHQRENGLGNEGGAVAGVGGTTTNLPLPLHNINNNTAMTPTTIISNNKNNNHSSGTPTTTLTTTVVAAAVNPSSLGLGKFKGKISKDVKLSDGSFISEEFYRYFDEDSLVSDIHSLLVPQHLLGSGNTLADWITTYNQPPAFAVLHSSSGRNSDVFIPAVSCILGRMDSALEQSLFSRLVRELFFLLLLFFLF
jgi:hypothetical protein